MDLAGERLLLEEPENYEEEMNGDNIYFCRVVSSHTRVIEPGEESVVEGYLVGEWTGGDDGLVEGLRDMEESRGLLVGRALIDMNREETPVRLFNPGQDPVVIYKNMTLASIEPVESPREPGGEGGNMCRTVSNKPPGEAGEAGITEEETAAVSHTHLTHPTIHTV